MHTHAASCAFVAIYNGDLAPVVSDHLFDRAHIDTQRAFFADV